MMKQRILSPRWKGG